VGEEQLFVRRPALDLDRGRWRDARRIGDDGSQRQRGLLEGFLARGADAADPDVGLVREMLPAHTVSSAVQEVAARATVCESVLRRFEPCAVTLRTNLDQGQHGFECADL